MARGQWTYTGRPSGKKLTAGEKLAITAACEQFIAGVQRVRHFTPAP